MRQTHPTAIDEFKNAYNVEFLGLAAEHSEADLHGARGRLLPAGAIEISQVRRLSDLQLHSRGRSVLRRFMERGHWRRARAGAADQRRNWVRPHWKGPDMATVIERTYKLKQ